MTWVLIGAAVGALVAFLGVYLRERRKSAGPGQRPLTTAQKERVLLEDKRRILDLQLGDVIEHMGETWVIEGVLLYDEEGTGWKTYLLGGGSDGRDRWLAIEDDDRLQIQLFEVLPHGVVDVSPDAPDELTVGEVTFRLDETGTARVRKRDKLGTRDMGKCRYADYAATSGRGALSLEFWGGDSPEVAVGRTLDEDDLMILPGS